MPSALILDATNTFATGSASQIASAAARSRSSRSRAGSERGLTRKMGSSLAARRRVRARRTRRVHQAGLARHGAGGQVAGQVSLPATVCRELSVVAVALEDDHA